MAERDELTINSAPPLPAAEDAGQAPHSTDVQSRPPLVPLPPTSSTGTGFNAPDAGIPPASGRGAQPATSPPMMTDETLPRPGDIDRDALEGQEAGPGSQAGAEAVSSPGPMAE